MLDISDLEVMRHMQCERGLTRIPAKVVSTKNLPAEIKTGLEAGASIHLAKPLDSLYLKQAVEMVFGA